MRRAGVGLLLACAVIGCTPRSPRSPLEVRDAYLTALRQDDPEAAYALLSPELRAALAYDDFAARWATMTAERTAILESQSDASDAIVLQGTTVHRDGRMLRWTELEETYYVVEGLPGIPRTTTPAQTIRAFIRAVRSTDMTQVRALLGPSLANALTEDWGARVDAIEEALEQPEALELSADHQRAVLHYDAARTITLEQTVEGWRIVGLE